MTQEQIKQLEKETWDAADSLRVNSKLTAGQYKDSALGLVLLRFAQNKYEEVKPIVDAAIPTGPRGKRDSYQERLLGRLPKRKNIAEAINNAMKQIEAEYLIWKATSLKIIRKNSLGHQ